MPHPPRFAYDLLGWMPWLGGLLLLYLGPERGWIRIDSEELVISFDSAGHVVDAGTARD